MSKSFDIGLTDDEFDSLIESINKRIDKKKYGETSFENLALRYGRKPVCPKCGSKEYTNDSYTSAGHNRYRCKECNCSYTLLSNSIFNSAKLSLHTIDNYIKLMSYNVPLELLNESQTADKDISFNYYAKPSYNEDRIELPFCFDNNKNLPYRINALIGKNGVGKTEIHSDLAESLSGYACSISEKEDSFHPKRPSIDRVISISFSAFDSFRKRSTNNKYNLNNYTYCGIQSDHGTLSLDELNDNFLNSYKRYRK